MSSAISEFYKDQTIFITGGTGLLGRLLIEKLLRVSGDVKRIYILIRVKKGKNLARRIEELLSKSCFNRLKSERPLFREKIRFMEGDCELENLGLSSANLAILYGEVSCIFHSAATIKFNEQLRKAVFINIRATRDLISIAKNCSNLKAFIHVSTAYSNCPQSEIKEEFYKPPIDVDKLFKLIETLDDDILDRITPILLGKWPNSYTFTKNVAEDVLKREIATLPLAIVRPSIIFNAVKEPLPGWSDTLQGILAVSIGFYVGIIRTIRVKPDAKFNLTPIDCVVNNILAVAWNLADDQNRIYNCTLPQSKALTWEQYGRICMSLVRQFPTNVAIWYPFVWLFESQFLTGIMCFVLHTIPAYIGDFLLNLFNQKPQFVKLYKKIEESQNLLLYFTLNSWTFCNDNTLKLWSKMSDVDKEQFRFIMDDLDWFVYLKNSLIGVRTTILNDPLKSLPKARVRNNLLFVANSLLIFMFLSILYLSVSYCLDFIV